MSRTTAYLEEGELRRPGNGAEGLGWLLAATEAGSGARPGVVPERPE